MLLQADRDDASLAQLEQIATAAGCRLAGVRRVRVPGQRGSRITLDLEGTARISLTALLEAYAALPGVDDVTVQRGPGETNA